MTAEVEVYRQPAEVAVRVPSDIDSWTQVAASVIKLANEIHDTPFVPDGLRGSVPATAAAILAGRELGLGPMTSLANVHVIKGKPALSAALMRALILAQGHQIETVDISDTRAVVRGRRRGEAAWEEASFTADQARKANIQLGGYPQDKLYARATSRLARRKFADVIAGMPYSAEELEDGDETPAAAGNGDAPKPRTARRRQAATNASPADAASPTRPRATPPAAPPPYHPPAEPAGEAPQPPLPGEEDSAPAVPDTSAAGEEPDDRDYDTPGTVTDAQLTRIWTTLTSDLGFAADEKDQARMACATIAGRELASSKELSRNEAKAVIDTLVRCKDRDALIKLLVATEGQASDG